MRRHFALLLSLLLRPTAPADGPLTLTVAFTSDLHGEIAPLAHAAPLIAALRRDAARAPTRAFVLVDAGDAFVVERPVRGDCTILSDFLSRGDDLAAAATPSRPPPVVPSGVAPPSRSESSFAARNHHRVIG